MRTASSIGRIRGQGALVWARGSGSLGLRFLAPLSCAHDPNQRNSANKLGFARPFVLSSHLPLVGLRGKRTGGPDLIDFSPGAVENEFPGSLSDLIRTSRISDRCGRFPGSNDQQQDSTSPGGKCGRAAGAHFPAVPARVRHASEAFAVFSNTRKFSPQ